MKKLISLLDKLLDYLVGKAEEYKQLATVT